MALHGGCGIVLAALTMLPWGCRPRPGPPPPTVPVTTVRGVVRDSATGRPIPGAHVRASYEKRVTEASRILAQAASDSLGQFALAVLARGRVYISARYIGYAPTVTSIMLPRDSAQMIVFVLPTRVIYLQQ